jgi:predicted transposase YbfD/YdcC
MVVERETFEVATQKTSFETSYCVSNQVPEPSTARSLAGELARAIRWHWGVESNNWIWDVTFKEDGVGCD